MPNVRVVILRYLGDDPQPGIVECALFDCRGRRWLFVEKTAVVSAENLNGETSYPQPGAIACEIIERRVDAAGREIVRISTEKPWHIESVDGVTEFEMLPDSVMATTE